MDELEEYYRIPTVDWSPGDLLDEIWKLEECVSEALNYRPLATDPLQIFVSGKCPRMIKEWNDRRKIVNR